MSVASSSFAVLCVCRFEDKYAMDRQAIDKYVNKQECYLFQLVACVRLVLNCCVHMWLAWGCTVCACG